MPVEITTYELRGGVAQDEAARAAVRLCRATEELGHDRARFYWEHGSRIVIISESADPDDFAKADVITGTVDREKATAGFELEALTRWVETRRLLSQAQGARNTEVARYETGTEKLVPR